MEKHNGDAESGREINRIYTPPPPQVMDPSKLPVSGPKMKKNKKRPPAKDQGDREKLTPAEEL